MMPLENKILNELSKAPNGLSAIDIWGKIKQKDDSSLAVKDVTDALCQLEKQGKVRQARDMTTGGTWYKV